MSLTDPLPRLLVFLHESSQTNFPNKEWKRDQDWATICCTVQLKHIHFVWSLIDENSRQENTYIDTCSHNELSGANFSRNSVGCFESLESRRRVTFEINEIAGGFILYMKSHWLHPMLYRESLLGICHEFWVYILFMKFSYWRNWFAPSTSCWISKQCYTKSLLIEELWPAWNLFIKVVCVRCLKLVIGDHNREILTLRHICKLQTVSGGWVKGLPLCVWGGLFWAIRTWHQLIRAARFKWS